MTLVIQQSWKFPELILFIFVMIWASDTFAYLAGRSFGKRPFAPKLSPKKTIEGFVGGIVGTLLTCGILNHYWEVVPDTVALAMALATSIAAPFGDLIASVLKREADVKDSGVFLPGHGGALDRLDSFLTAAPLSVLIYSYLI
jgi:phosphatidate cytidylyltransferase